MGWVSQRIRELDLHYERGEEIFAFWNRFRDAVGEAMGEFNFAVGEKDQAYTDDCKAKGVFCLRVHKKGKSEFREVFLNSKQRQLELASGPDDNKVICGYRANADLTHLEFYSLDEEFVPVPGLPDDACEPDMSLTVDQACEMALGDLLFDPPPTGPYRK